MSEQKGWLSTHILDTANGCPAEGIKVTLFRLENETREELVSTITNHDGRTDAPLLDKSAIQAGWYELIFEAGVYFERRGQQSSQQFLDVIPIRFNIADADEHYHVPLLVSPFSYSTYRGS